MKYLLIVSTAICLSMGPPGPPGGGVGGPGGPPNPPGGCVVQPCVPIDGGITFLLIAAVLYGAYRTLKNENRDVGSIQ